MGMLKEAAKKSAINTATGGMGGVAGFAMNALKRYRKYREQMKKDTAAKRKAEAERRADTYEPGESSVETKPKKKKKEGYGSVGKGAVSGIRKRQQALEDAMK